MDQLPFDTNDFAENPEPRVPCILLIDVSKSMQGDPIEQLTEGLKIYKKELADDGLASKRVEVAIITFGTEVKVACQFTTIEGFEPPTLKASGRTSMGKAVAQAMEMLATRKQSYRDNGISYYRPWLFLISDGVPNDSGWEEVAKKAREEEQKKAFKMFCVGVEGARLDVLGLFSNTAPVRLKGLQFREMFEWLSASQQSVSRSSPGEETPLQNPATPDGWASIS